MSETAYQLEVKPDGRVQLPLELRKQLQRGSRLIVRVRLGIRLGVPVLTADRAWSRLTLGLQIELIG